LYIHGNGLDRIADRFTLCVLMKSVFSYTHPIPFLSLINL
jgi:hypothetical protein